MISKKRVLSFLFLILFGSYHYSQSRLILSDPKVKTSSFPFLVGPHTFFNTHGRFFVGAIQAVSDNDFAIAAAARGDKLFKPLTPEKVYVDGEADQENPLFGSQIQLLVSFGSKVLTVAANDPSTFYLLDDVSMPPQIGLLTARDLADSNGITTNSILSLVAQTKPLTLNTVPGLEEPFATFAAVSNPTGNFDGNGSGIAYAGLIVSEVDGKQVTRWQLFDAQNGELGNKAMPVDKSTEQIKINDPLSVIENAVDTYWDANVQRLYVALQVQAGANANDGARAILVGSVTTGKMAFQSIAPDSAFAGTNQIVGAIGANERVSIHKVRTLQTTTYLRYLVVVGGNGDPASTKRKVFALPLVDLSTIESDGSLANVNSIPMDQFVAAPPYRFQTRRFVEPAINQADLFTESSVAAKVGGSVDLPGDITDISASKDAIFVSVASDSDQEAGIFYSQALFDNVGRIKGWTNWQRAGAAGKILGFALDYVDSNFWYMPSANGFTTNDVYRTGWSKRSNLAQLGIAMFPAEDGGIQGLFDFPYNTEGFSTSIGSRISVIAMTGYEKVVFVQSGRDFGAVFGPETDFTNIFSSDNDGLSGFNPGSSVITVTGPVLDELGPIVAAEVGRDKGYGWFFIGGSGGLAVLTKPDGTGWDAASGLGEGFDGLTQDMAFKKIGNFKNVRKLISSGGQLFILTAFGLYRININPFSFTTDNLEVVTLAKSRQLIGGQGSFADVIISGPLAMLATNVGLLRSGDNVDIQIVTDSDAVGWTELSLPETAGSLNGVGPISRLYAISPTGQEKDVFIDNTGSTSIAGNVYALNTYIGYHQAQVYRLQLNLLNGNVAPETIVLFPDLFVAGKRTFFTNLGSYRNYIATDGAVFFISRSRYITSRPFLFMLTPSYRSGQIDSGRTGIELPLRIDNFRSIGNTIRRSANGSWMTHGDFGLRINQ